MGAFGIRVLAGGALSNDDTRHPMSSQRVVPMGTSADYRDDVEQAHRLAPLVTEGHVQSLTELALRFAITNPAISFSACRHFRHARRSSRSRRSEGGRYRARRSSACPNYVPESP